MAGIGFVLRRLAREDTLTASLKAYAHGAAVAAGPWIFTILALGGVELFGRGMLPTMELQRFSVVVIYNFAFSLVISGPIVLVVTRRLADQIHAKDVSEAPGMFLGALGLVLLAQGALGVPFYGWIVDMPLAERLLALVGLLVIGGIWLAAAFITALKSFSAITTAFAAGMAVAFLEAVLLMPKFGVLGMLTGFTVGLAVIFFGIAAMIFAEFPYTIRRPFAFLGDFQRYWEFALVGLLYNAGIWVDKCIMWFAPGHVVIAGAMPISPAYDGAMLLANLTMIPSLVFFLIWIETRFFENYLRFYRDIERDATAAEISANHRSILRDLVEGFRNIAVLQAVVCYLAILVAPGLIGIARGGVEMVSIFRYGTLGATFHVLLLATLIIISYFDFRGLLLSVTAVFFFLNLTLTLGTLWLGLEYRGYGYLLATLISLVFGYSAAASRILRLPYMTFIANNRGL